MQEHRGPEDLSNTARRQLILSLLMATLIGVVAAVPFSWDYPGALIRYFICIAWFN